MEFFLLGPLAVRSGGVVVPMPAGKQRVVLAALLLNTGRVVPVEELAEAVWGEWPPPSARVTVQNYVCRLRKALGGAGRAIIATQPRGYSIDVDAGELDVTRFEALQGAARAAAQGGSWGTAAGRAREALALWRGEPLEDMESELLAAREIPRLAELRLQALEIRIEADLRLGHHGDVIAQLRQLAVAHPLRERLHALLMLALYRDGCAAEALSAYQQVRKMLAAELGTEPCSELRELHQRMLSADPALAFPDPVSATASGAGRAVPRQLPTPVAHFTGRAGELDALTSLLDRASTKAPEAVVISAIGGTAGVGKTALAVHWAHQVASRFSDGQLYVNLRGHDPGPPVTAADALAGFLRALGVAGRDMPAEEAERATRYRSLLAGRRMLVVVDNAGSVEQVRPLLPGTPSCVVVVTSRNALAGLVARDGATRLDLDLLPLTEAVGLLQALIGGRVDADPSAAAVLAARCARLPLALRVAAELAVTRPQVTLAGLADELADQRRLLDLLDADGDPRTAVRAVFSWSYRHLDDAAARAFRLAGLHPGPDHDSHAAAALTASTVAQGRRLLDRLSRAHLVFSTGPGRYSMHDLLRAYAGELAAEQDSEQERRAALTRLFGYYLHTAAAAMDTLYPAERHRRPCIPPPASPTPPTDSPAAARGWLDTERATLVAVAARTADHGWPGHTTRLAATLYRYLNDGHYPEAVTIHSCARRAARRVGDRAAEAAALTSIGVLDGQQGRYLQATGHLQQALALFRETADRTGQARALGNLGCIDQRQGRYQQAADHHRQALALFREIGDPIGHAYALADLGCVDLRRGRYQQATGYLSKALALFRETSDRAGSAYALGGLGCADLRRGRYQQATGYLSKALALFRENGDRAGEAETLSNLGDVDLRQGRYREAAGHHEQGLALCRAIGDRPGEARALNSLGEVFRATSQPGLARTQHTAAFDLARQIGDTYEQARAHSGLACSLQAAGDLSQALHHWQQARTLYSILGVPEADQVPHSSPPHTAKATVSRESPQV